MDERVRKRLERLKADAAAGGYHINPDEEFTAGLVEGLLANADRYGVESCPCRLLTGDPKSFEIARKLADAYVLSLPANLPRATPRRNPQNSRRSAACCAAAQHQRTRTAIGTCSAGCS